MSKAEKIGPALGWVGYGFAIGSITMVLAATKWQFHIPGWGATTACDFLPQSPLATIWGVPTGYVGLFTIFAIFVTASFESTLRFARILAIASASYGVFLQFRTYTYVEELCPWCIVACVGYIIGAVGLWFKTKALTAPDRFILTGLASGMPMIAASLIASPSVPAPTLDISSIPRNMLTGSSDHSTLDVVLFASPQCPTCRQEFPTILDWVAQHKATLKFHGISISRSADEVRAIGLMLASAQRHDDILMRFLMSESPLQERVSIAKNKLNLSRDQWLECQKAIVADRSLAKSTQVRTVPTIIVCLPQDACRVIDRVDRL